MLYQLSYTPLSQETDSNRRFHGYEPCEIPLLYPAIFCLEEPFQHVHLLTTRGSHYTTDRLYAFGTRLYIHAHCHVLFLPPNFQSPNSKWEKMELNHPNHNGNCFTGSPATPTVYSPLTRKNRVSNRFIVLCFPLSTSFSAVASLDIFMRLSWVVPFKNSLFQRALR